MRKLIFGCGYLGSRVASAWRAQGHEVVAVTRSAVRADVLAAQGLQPLVGDLADSLDLSGLDDLDTVLFAVGFDRTSGQSIREVYVGGLRNVLDRLSRPVGRFIYISSTGVYGGSTGEWIDEESECQPAREGSKACLEAEHLLQAHELGARAVILRLAGIYGPGRLPKLQAVIEGKAIATAEHGYLNLIHVDDAVQAVLAAEIPSELPDVINVADGSPVLRGDFYRQLAKISGAPLPRFSVAPQGSRSAGREATDKRINNSRMLSRLSLRLRYPSYREGLAAILGASEDAGARD